MGLGYSRTCLLEQFVFNYIQGIWQDGNIITISKACRKQRVVNIICCRWANPAIYPAFESQFTFCVPIDNIVLDNICFY
jgi:hypothetical protein